MAKLQQYRVDQEIDFDHVQAAITGSVLTACRTLVNMGDELEGELLTIAQYIAKGRQNESSPKRNPLTQHGPDGVFSPTDPPSKLPDEVIGWIAMGVLNENDDPEEFGNRIGRRSENSYKYIGRKIKDQISSGDSVSLEHYVWASPPALMSHAFETLAHHIAAKKIYVLDTMCTRRCGGDHISRVKIPSKKWHKHGRSYQATAVMLAMALHWIELEGWPEVADNDYVEWADTIFKSALEET